MKKLLVALCVLLSTSSALAEPSVAAEVDANYVFDDDPLNALGDRVHIPIIKTRTRFVRPTLLRPRLHFVRELQKSVEDL